MARESSAGLDCMRIGGFSIYYKISSINAMIFYDERLVCENCLTDIFVRYIFDNKNGLIIFYVYGEVNAIGSIN